MSATTVPNPSARIRRRVGFGQTLGPVAGGGPTMNRGRGHVLPGFGLTLGTTVFYLGVVVLLPIGALTVKAWVKVPAVVQAVPSVE